MVPVTVQGAVPLLAFQNAIVRCRCASKTTADPQRFLQIPGQHLPLLGTSLVVVHVIVLGASVLVQQQSLYRHILNELHQHDRCERLGIEHMLSGSTF